MQEIVTPKMFKRFLCAICMTILQLCSQENPTLQVLLFEILPALLQHILHEIVNAILQYILHMIMTAILQHILHRNVTAKITASIILTLILIF